LAIVYSSWGIFLKVLLATLTVVMLLTPNINFPILGPIKFLDLYVAAFFIAYLIRAGLQRRLAKLGGASIMTFLILITWLLVLEILNTTSDTTGFLLLARSLITVLAALGFSTLIWKYCQERSLSFFFQVIIICAITQGLVLWLSYVSPEFRGLMDLFFYRDVTRGNEHLVFSRVPGFVSNGGDGLSLNQGLLCVVAMAGVFYLCPSGLKRAFLLGIIFLATVGAAFAGRSGFYIGCFFMSWGIILYHNGLLRPARVIYLVLFYVFLGASLLVLLDPIGSWGLALRNERGWEDPMVRLLSGLIAIKQDVPSTDQTLSVLLGSMVVFPQDTLHFLFGNNNFTNQFGPDLNSDIGYIRMIHGFGLVGLLAFLLGVYGYPIWAIYRQRLRIHRQSFAGGSQTIQFHFLSQVLTIVLIFGLVGHWKIYYLTSRIYLFILFVLFSLIYLKFSSTQPQILSSNK
jgi:hypothetical protein